MKTSPTKTELRNFGTLIGFILPSLVGWLLPFLTGHSFRYWTLFIAIPIFIFGLLAPRFLQPIYQFWMKLGNMLGWINSKIILMLVFFFVLQPIAIIMKLFQYDPLRKDWNRQKSYKELKPFKETDLTRIF